MLKSPFRYFIVNLCIASTIAILAVGCAQTQQASSGASMQNVVASDGRGDASTSSAVSDRKVVRTADMEVIVDDPNGSSSRVRSFIETSEGYVEQSTVESDEVRLILRIPADQLDAVMDSVGRLGDVNRESTSADDVTDQYVDLKARLESKRALRDRLEQLLNQATSVQDVLRVEEELSRVQSDVESMEARFERLQSQVALSSLSVRLKKKRILGPVGYVGYGLWWGIKKLFVIR